MGLLKPKISAVYSSLREQYKILGLDTILLI